MQQIQNTDPSESLRDHVRENAILQLRENIIDLCQRIRDDENIRKLQLFCVPEEHPGPNTHIPQRVIWHELDDLVQRFFLGGVVAVEFPEAVEPGELEELLGEEEAGDEVGLGAEEGEVAVVDVFH